MKMNDSIVDTLKNSALFQDFSGAYSGLTGMPIALRPLETWSHPFRDHPNQNPFCALMASCSKSCAMCLQAHDTLVRSCQDGSTTLTCSYGLCEFAAPIKNGETIVGYLQSGQVMNQVPTELAFERAAAIAEQSGLNIRSPETKEAYFKTPVRTLQEIQSACSLLEIFADHLSIKTNQIVLRNNQSEPPVVTHAKKYIEEHCSEDLTLGKVAAAVHASLFYFCKIFHRATGLRFTEYVSRVRVERAKQLLLNPNLRISEAAYQVGFQSLTHFNRVFKSLTGLSPTEYRRRLPR
ncbi:MAG: helix-turn-helix domain-containing protein [Verrucomicrobia bacterium]|nr:helix-turn-helix domain-containing protein [Verrucomicrobiota bacterium]